MDYSELLEKLKKDSQLFGEIIWDALTPFERDRLLKRIDKQMPEIESKYRTENTSQDTRDWTPPPLIPQESSMTEPKEKLEITPKEPAQSQQDELIDSPYERSVWNLKTLYQIAHQDMIEQRTTMMKFLLNNYGIEAVEEFFLKQNPAWAETLKVGKMKKIFAKLISKLAPRLILNKLSDIIIENAQYLVPLDHIKIQEASDDRKIIEITQCPVLKQFKKTLKALKFDDLEKRYICTFACVPVLAQMASVGNCAVTSDYTKDEKGCSLHVYLKAKQPSMLEISESDSVVQVRNGPSP